MIEKIDLSEEQRRDIGRVFLMKIDEIKDALSPLRQKWVKALQTYEGTVSKDPTFPFVGSSDAWAPLISTHTDVFHARLSTGITRQDPIMLIMPAARGQEDFAADTQEFSKYLEREGIHLRDLMDTVIGKACKYGDAIVYLPWVQETRKVMSFDSETQDFKPEEVPVIDGPMPKVYGPDEVYIYPLHETDIQAAQLFGYRYEIDAPTVKRFMKTGVFYKEESEALLRQMIGEPDEGLGDYLSRDMNQGEHSQSEDEIQRERERSAGIQEYTRQTVTLAHLFVRYDIDDDGIEEELNIHLDLDNGVILRAAYNHYRHQQRPFVRFQFLPRDGMFYSIGIPELLFNIQDIYNTTLRQIIDNNTLANTQIFVAKAGGAIKSDEKIYPGRILFTSNPAEDFKPMAIGTGQVSVRLNELSLLQSWAERRTGLSEPSMGRQQGDRTPATTTLALLEQSALRPDRILDAMGRSMETMWHQLLQLYAQFRPTGIQYQYILGDAGMMYGATWASAPPEVLRERLLVHARMSGANMNRATVRQESMALYQQASANWQTVIQIATMYGQTQDPVMKELLLMLLRGNRQLQRRVLDSFDVKDQDNLNPNYEEVVANVTNTFGLEGLAPNPGPALGAAEASATAAGRELGPEVPPGRPLAGTPRLGEVAAPGPEDVTGI